MIGVALATQQDWIVSEFFQLFKTPWEKLDPDMQYEVVITDHVDSVFPDAGLVIYIHRETESHALNADEPGGVATWLDYDKKVFPVYNQIQEIDFGDTLVRIDGSDICAGGIRVNGGRTTIHLGYDFFQEASHLLTQGQPASCAEIPTLDLHINNLRNWILSSNTALIEIPPIAKDSNFFACLTHDVDFAGLRYHLFDRTAAGFLYRAVVQSFKKYLTGSYSLDMLRRNWICALQLPLIYLGLRSDPWNSFSQYREIEGDAPSTFYFVPFKGQPGLANKGTTPSIRAVKYRTTDFGDEIRELILDGCEVGVHGIDSWTDSEKGSMELGEIQNLAGDESTGIRMHWLYFDTDSPSKLEKAGFSYDSTSGYNGAVGYTAGTSQVFKPEATDHLLELPMHIMDSALFYPDRLNMSLKEGALKMSNMIDKAELLGGVLTFNWHDRSIAPERLWDTVYRDAIDEMRKKGARFSTAAGVVNWFRKRRSVIFHSTPEERGKGGLTVSCPNISSDDGMLLRYYGPPDECSQQAPGDYRSRSYLDTLLENDTSIGKLA